MNMIRLLLLLLLCPSLVLAETLSPADFAAGLTLPEAKDGGLYALKVPLAVYEQRLRPDLGDLRVFNGAGEVIPHALRRPETLMQQQSSQMLPFLPLQCNQRGELGDLSLQINRNADGAIIHLNTKEVGNPKASSCYLIDASGLNKRAEALELDWQGNNDALFSVSLNHSQDLTSWSALSSPVVLADLRHEGQVVTARRIPLQINPKAYLQLICNDCREPLQLREVRAILGAAAMEPKLQWLPLAAPRGYQEGKELFFEYPQTSALNVRALRLRLPQTNSLARLRIEARASDQDAWRSHYSGLIYDLHVDNKRLQSEAIACASNNERLWRVAVAYDGAGLSEQHPPQLELGWQADELLFLGRGPGPYMLAFGSAKAATQAFDHQGDALLAVMRASQSEALVKPLIPGPVQALGGQKTLVEPVTKQFDWKKALLWLLLLGGVLLLALMTKSILREMK